LPQPEGPSRMQNSPSATSNPTSVRTSLAPNRLDKFLTESAAIIPPFDSAFHRAGRQAAHNAALKNQREQD
jgi:hypothetical protein